MERKIKFKAKRLNNGEWIEGDLLHQGSDVFICNLDENGMLIDTEVDPSTVCQFTGLKDKDGKPIFENDSVLFKDLEGIVFYDDFTFCVSLALPPSSERSQMPLGYGNNKKMKVIGNHFDRKEGEE